MAKNIDQLKLLDRGVFGLAQGPLYETHPLVGPI